MEKSENYSVPEESKEKLGASEFKARSAEWVNDEMIHVNLENGEGGEEVVMIDPFNPYGAQIIYPDGRKVNFRNPLSEEELKYYIKTRFGIDIIEGR